MPEFIANLRTNDVKPLIRPMANRCNQSSHMTYPHQHLKFEIPKKNQLSIESVDSPVLHVENPNRIHQLMTSGTLRQGTPRGHFGSALAPPLPRRLYPGAHVPAPPPVLEAPARVLEGRDANRANRGDFPSGTMDVS